jgi:hypothetical protein
MEQGVLLFLIMFERKPTKAALIVWRKNSLLYGCSQYHLQLNYSRENSSTHLILDFIGHLTCLCR